jgi:uncharacterized protein (TIGR04255 family)
MALTKIRKHYNRAPVVEALIDIQIEGALSGTAQDVEQLAESVKNDFPARLPLHSMQMGFQVPAAGGAPEIMGNQQLFIGYRLDRPGRVLQFRINGFSYSHLAPYSNWETFSAEAEVYWDQYIAAIKPLQAARTAVRMINRLPLPAADIRLDTCLNFYPTLPDSLPSDAKSLFMQLQLPMKHVDPDAVAIIGLYTAPPLAFSPNAIMLDIDFIVQKRSPIGDVFKTLRLLGDTKDDIFEACIKDPIRELIS